MKHKALFPALLVAALLLLGTVYRFGLRWGDYGTGDWLAYWSVARALPLGHGFFDMAWLEATQRAVGYNRVWIGSHYYPVFLLWNPPPLVALLVPLGALGLTGATLGWLGLSAGVYGVAAARFNRALPHPMPDGVALVVAFGFLPFLAAGFWGQVTPLIAALVALAWLAQRRGRAAVAGLLLVPTLLKPHLVFVPVGLLLWAALRRRDWTTFGAGGALLGALVAAAWALDPHWLRDWLRQGSPAEWQTFALWDVAKTAFGLPRWTQFVGLPLGLVVGAWRYRDALNPSARQLGEATLLGLLFSPYLWHHDVIVALPAALWLGGALWRRGLRWVLFAQTAANLWLMPWDHLSGRFLPYMLLFVALWRWTGRPQRPAHSREEPKDGPALAMDSS